MKKLFCVLTVVCLLASVVAVGSVSAAANKEVDEQMLNTEPTATATATNVEPVMRGDITADGVVNMKDVLMLRAFLCGHVNFIEAENVWLYWDHHPEHAKKTVTVDVPNADANADGEINMKDVLAVRKYLAGIGTL